MKKTSKEGIALITEFEGLRLETYKCSAGVPTIGYGHTGKDVKPGMKITRDEAERLLIADLVRFEDCVNRHVSSFLTQNRFDSLVSLAFNIGCAAFAKSTLCRLVNADPDDPAIEGQFAAWNKAGGKVVQGLVIRRRKESQNYFKA